MKVTIEDGCICCGACESFCEAVFKVEDNVIVNEKLNEFIERSNS